MPQVRFILFSLLGGSVLTLLSAWIPPLINPPVVSFPGLTVPPGTSAAWVGAAHTAWLGEPAWLATVGTEGVGVRRSAGMVEATNLAFVPAPVGSDGGQWQYLLTSGWPMYAFHGGGTQYPQQRLPSDQRAPEVLALPSWVPTRQNHPPTIPVAPLWRGLGLNVAWWTIVVALPAWGVGSFRRALRRRRMTCTRCGYSRRGGGSACPECGESWPTSGRASA